MDKVEVLFAVSDGTSIDISLPLGNGTTSGVNTLNTLILFKSM